MLNGYLLSLILGIVEGLTEFLPVSSTAHLRICEALLRINLSDPYWKMYSIVIQLGAILCLPLYFRQRIGEFLATFPRGPDGSKTALTHPLGLTMVAFVFTAAPAFLLTMLTKVIGKNLENLYAIALAMIIGGVVMWIVDARCGRPRAVPAPPAGARGFQPPADGRQPTAGPAYRTNSMEQMSLGQAIWIGCCQVLSAVFPGTSRSMSTIAAGQIAGMSRPAALEFSFFLSMPTMIVATGYDLLRTLRHAHGGEEMGRAPASAEEWIILVIGFAVSFLVAYLVVAWFMNWVRKRGFVPFAIYRLLVGGAVLALLHAGLLKS
jgi:undecaprenyl-diphosphatase